MEKEEPQPTENTEAQIVKEGNGEAVKEDVSKTDEKEAVPAEESDVYAYTRREEFTSENFKIELRGLPRFYHVGVRLCLAGLKNQADFFFFFHYCRIWQEYVLNLLQNNSITFS